MAGGDHMFTLIWKSGREPGVEVKVMSYVEHQQYMPMTAGLEVGKKSVLEIKTWIPRE